MNNFVCIGNLGKTRNNLCTQPADSHRWLNRVRAWATIPESRDVCAFSNLLHHHTIIYMCICNSSMSPS